VVQKYLSRISGPLLDRIDIQVEVVPVPFKELSVSGSSEKSQVIRERVMAARKIQEERYLNNEGVYCNAQIPSKEIRKVCRLSEEGNMLLKHAMERLNLSARAYDGYSKFPAPLPTWRPLRISGWSTWQKRSNTAAWTRGRGGVYNPRMPCKGKT